MRRLAAHLAYRQSRRSILPAGIQLAVTLFVVTASAAVSPRLSFDQMVDRSPVIIEARVVGSRTAWDPAHKYIWTHYELQVTDTIRGSSAVTVVSEPGGSLDGVNQAFSGSLGYSPGEHVFLFLFRTPLGYWRTTGGSQGKVMVGEDGRIHSDIGNPDATVEAHLPQASPREPIGVSAFKSLVRSLAQSRAANETR